MPCCSGSSAPDAADLDGAIWRTIAYAGLFQYPLTVSELRLRLMDMPAAAAEIAARLHGPRLRSLVTHHDGFVMRAGCESWVGLRHLRSARSAALLAGHSRALRAIARTPFVRMVALSGACAHGNAADDDVDVFLITRPARAWTVMLLLMVASKLAGLRRSLCVNYVLAEDGMALPERDRFTASELVGLKPLAGRDTYRRFVRANAWAAPLHPNFFESYERESEGIETCAGSASERLLDVMGADLFERAARAILEPYLRRRVCGDGVLLTADRLKLHGRDHRPSVTRAFDELQVLPREARST